MPSRILLGFVAIIVVMIAIPVALAWSARRKRHRLGRGATPGGPVVLRMPRGHHAILATIAILPFGGIAAVAFAADWAPGAEANRWILGGLMALAGVISGGYLLLLEVRGAIRVDDFSIEKVGAIRSRRAAWSEVAKLTYNPLNSWFFLTLARGGRLYVVDGLEGIGDFAEIALRRLPREVLASSPDAEEVLRELAAY